MSTIQRLLDRVASVATYAACAVVIIMMLHVTADVIGRTLFNRPLIGTLEIVTAYYMVAIAFLPIAWIAKERGHIVVELFTSMLHGRALSLVDAIAALISFVFVVLFAYETVLVAIHFTEIREAWESGAGFIEVWPSRWVVPIGFSIMALYVLLQFIDDLRGKGPDTGGEG